MKKIKSSILLLFLTTIMLFACKRKEINNDVIVEETTTIEEQTETNEVNVNAKSADVIFSEEELEQFSIAEKMAKKEKETIVETTMPLAENIEITGFDKKALPYLSQQKFDGWQNVEVNNEIVAKSNNAQIDYVFNMILDEAKGEINDEKRKQIYEYTKKNVEESNGKAIEQIKKGYMFTYNNEGFPNEAPPQGMAMQIINPNNGLKYCYLNIFGKQEWTIDTIAHQTTRGELNLDKIMRNDGTIITGDYHISEEDKREIIENIARAYK